MTGSWLRAAIVSSVWASVGCNAVLGIEERTFEASDAGGIGDAGDAGLEVSCEAYCDLVTTNCAGEFRVYASPTTCLATCALLPLGSPGDMGNTVACRMKQAKSAGDTAEFGDHCPNAGPGGRGICGDDCTFFCTNLPLVCGSTVTIPPALTGATCFDTCDMLNDLDTDTTYSVDADDDEHSRDCRILHLTNATANVLPHCMHTIGEPGGPCSK